MAKQPGRSAYRTPRGRRRHPTRWSSAGQDPVRSSLPKSGSPVAAVVRLCPPVDVPGRPEVERFAPRTRELRSASTDGSPPTRRNRRYRLVDDIGRSTDATGGTRGDGECRKEARMALFIDEHAIDGGVKASDVAQAHLADLQTQEKYGVSYLRYWVDESAGKIFCLVDAPDAEAANTVHREAHGLVAQAIHPVIEGA